ITPEPPPRPIPVEAGPSRVEIREPEPLEEKPARVEQRPAPAVDEGRISVVEVQRAFETSPPAPTPESMLPEPPLQAQRKPVPIFMGLRKTRESFLARVRAAITGGKRADEIYEGLEEALIGADVGVETSVKLVEAVRSRLKNDARADTIREALKQEI